MDKPKEEDVGGDDYYASFQLDAIVLRPNALKALVVTMEDEVKEARMKWVLRNGACTEEHLAIMTCVIGVSEVAMLDLRNNGLGPKCVDALRLCGNLERLVLRDNSGLKSNFGEFCREMREVDVTYLSLADCDLDDGDIDDIIVLLRHNSKLKRLELMNNQISLEGITKMFVFANDTSCGLLWLSMDNIIAEFGRANST